ncbi:hypothetical protein LWI28_022254 [Acer negundo]|uniref:CCHC-type domain-containing protein n=1 Tax=Acer negundo TaxID=4023 RepID=A0AAD5JIN9_ACENE|nr:hypothetical protein LWI28_022254 [Acer negundo]
MTGRLGSGISSLSSRPAAVGSSSAPNIFSAPNQQPRTAGGFKCFNCEEVGHRQSECERLGKRVFFTDTDEGNDDDVVIGGEPQFDKDDEVIEDWVEGDVGPLLMARPTYDTVTKAVELEKEELVAGPPTRNWKVTATASNGRGTNKQAIPSSYENEVVGWLPDGHGGHNQAQIFDASASLNQLRDISSTMYDPMLQGTSSSAGQHSIGDCHVSNPTAAWNNGFRTYDRGVAT